MSIRTNSKSVNFTFDFEDSSGDTLSFSLRFHHTEEYGPSLAVLDEEDNVLINFPVEMFTEVTDFLTQQGITESKRLPTPQMPQKILKPTSAPRVALPKPRVISSKPTAVVAPVSAGAKVFKNANTIDMDDDSPVDAPFIPPDLEQAEIERQAALTSSLEGAVPVDSLSVQSDAAAEMVARAALAKELANKIKSEGKPPVPPADKSIRRK